MKLTKILSMCFIGQRVGKIGKATLLGIKDCYSLEPPAERTFEEVPGLKSNYNNIACRNSGHYRISVSA